MIPLLGIQGMIGGFTRISNQDLGTFRTKMSTMKVDNGSS